MKSWTLIICFAVSVAANDDPNEDNIKIEWLPNIERFTVRKAIIDVSLYQIGIKEDCYIGTPDGTILNFNEISTGNHEAITVHPVSGFVSCRVTIGPILKDYFIGNWTIVGSYEKDGVTHIRKQATLIEWPNNPDQEWSEIIEDTQNYVVNFGFNISPLIYGSGSAQSCHIVTPDGEDLTILEESRYPNITRVRASNSYDCSISLGPIHQKMLGTWSMYVETGFATRSVVRRPFNLYLYDEDNPYNQAYNKTYLDPRDISVRLGNTIRTNVSGHRSTDILDSCYLERPDGQRLELHQGLDYPGVLVEDTEFICLIAIGPIERDFLGEWKLIGKFNGRGLFHEEIQTFRIILEDPTKPMEDPSRTITYLDHEVKKTKLGGQHRLIISRDSFTVVHSCHIRTPDGLQFQFMQNFDVAGVQIIETDNSRVSCGVEISILSEDQIGNWTLIARESGTNGEIERRFPFTIYVEEWVSSLPDKQAVVAEQNDFFIRLEHLTELHSTCQLLTPENKHREKEYDERYVETCGFIIRNVTVADAGTWEIRYGNRITYRSQVALKVQELPSPSIQDLVLIKARPVNLIIGPENAVYCKLEDPSSISVFNGFGPCRLDIDNVRTRHEGLWRLYASLPGHMISVEHYLRVVVRDSEPHPTVTTQITTDPLPAVILSCSVFSPTEPTVCKFRDPSGRILIASQGVGEDRYTFHGSGVSFNSNKYHMDCGIKIRDPIIEDLGIWRCAIDSVNDTYFGFLSVLCPWVLQDPDVVDKIISEPELRPSQENINVLEGDSTQILCRISSAITYCHFRSHNGTVINISPGLSTDNIEYLGQGFEAGECGLRIQRTSTLDGGSWTCNVGLYNVTVPELSHSIDVEVQERFVYDQYLLEDSSLVVGGVAHDGLLYCRFIRSDGLAFTTLNPPPGYFPFGTIETGYCGMTISTPSQMDRGSWTIVLKAVGQLQEYAVTTKPIDDCDSGFPIYGLLLLYVFIGLLGLVVISIVLLNCLRKTNRTSVFERVRIIRNSLRSYRKEPLTDENSVAVVDVVRSQAYSPASA